MNQDILDQLAAMCGRSLPADYIDLLANYPQELTTAVRAIDESDSLGTVADAELLQSLECVIALNLEVRGQPLVTPDGTEQLWPDQFAVIGENGSGNYFCIDVNRDIEGIIEYDHQSVEFSECAESLQDFVDMLLETFVDGVDENDWRFPDEEDADT